MMMRFLVLFSICNVGIVVNAAITGTFDFEDVAPPQGVNNRVDFNAPLTLTNDGVSMTIQPRKRDRLFVQ